MKNKNILSYITVALRWYLAFYMLNYGYSKMTGGQFGIKDPNILNKPLKEIETFYLAWYLFGKSKIFSISGGILQILCATLIIFDRTVIIGCLLLFPILFQILIVDAAFTTDMFGAKLVIRLTGMILANLCILLYYKDSMLKIGEIAISDNTPTITYTWWIILLLPIVGFLMDFLMGILLFPLHLF